MRLENKIALIVGSTSGIGKAMAETFAKEGAVAIVTGRREEKGLEVVKKIEEQGHKADFIQFDVTDMDSYEAFIQKILDKYGRIDSFVYNAGIAPVQGSYLYDTNEEVWDSVLNTNLKAAFFLTQKIIPALKASKGTIVYTCSLAGISAQNANGGVVYGSGKAALSHMTKIVALQLAKDGVRVNGVAPGLTMTEIFVGAPEEIINNLKTSIPLGQIADPEDQANAALFLCSDEAKNITGQILCVDGGASIG